MSASPRNFADWSRQAVDLRLTYNGNRQIDWLQPALKLGDFTAVMSLQSGGYGDILLATVRTAAPPGDKGVAVDADGLCQLNEAETRAARAEFRSLGSSATNSTADRDARVSASPAVVVLKVPKQSLTVSAKEKAFKKALRALLELKDANIPGVALMRASCPSECIEVYNYYPCDLAAAAREILSRVKCLTESFLFYWALQLAEAITGLHERGILHCDIHPENVLLDADGNLLLHDFGLSKRLPADAWQTSHRRRTAGWVKIPRKFRDDARQFAMLQAGWWPPELEDAFRGGGGGGGSIGDGGSGGMTTMHMNHTVDWYGLGATLFVLHTGSYPLRHFSETQLARMLERPGQQLHRLQQQEHLTPNFSHFILQLLREKIPDRLGHSGDGREVLSHVCVRSSPLFRCCDSWEQRRERIRLRQLPAPYRIVWGWPEFVQRLERYELPRIV